MAAIWEIPMPPTDKLVMLALADCANDGGDCWPSIATVARKSGVSERSVQRAIRWAQEAGLIEREEVVGKGCKYRLTPRHAVTPTPDTVTGRQPDGATGATQTPDTVSPKPSRTIKPSQSASHPEKGARAKGEAAHRLPDDWEPVPLTPGLVAYEIVAAWQPGRMERELSKFRDHWAAASGQQARKHDWQAAWRKWIGNADDWGSSAGNGANGRMGGPPSDPLLAIRRAAGAAIARGAGDH